MNFGESHWFARVPEVAGSAPLSLAPGFSRVLPGRGQENRFNGLSRCVRETAEAIVGCSIPNTRLKPGANERAALMSAERAASAGALLLFARCQRSAILPQPLGPSLEL